jgi:uncharacterized membrane protein YczE
MGLAISAVGIWLTIQARLGVAPWEVLHIGLAAKVGIGVGTAPIVLGAALVVMVAMAGVSGCRHSAQRGDDRGRPQRATRIAMAG